MNVFVLAWLEQFGLIDCTQGFLLLCLWLCATRSHPTFPLAQFAIVLHKHTNVLLAFTHTSRKSSSLVMFWRECLYRSPSPFNLAVCSSCILVFPQCQCFCLSPLSRSHTLIAHNKHTTTLSSPAQLIMSCLIRSLHQ